MTKTEFIQRAVLALMANPEPEVRQFRNSDDIDTERVVCAEEQWDALVRKGYGSKKAT